MMTFMVLQGFALLEIRKLYFDELFEFYKQTVYVLEKRGDFKEGTFDKIAGASSGEATVDQLRKGLRKIIT